MNYAVVFGAGEKTLSLDDGKMKSKGRSVIWVALFMVWSVACSCSVKDDEDVIRTIIEKGARLAEDHDIQGILHLTSQQFEANPGKLNRTNVKAVLWRTFKYYGPISVYFPRPHVQLEEAISGATAQLPFLIVKRDQSFPELERLRDEPVQWLNEVGEHADLYRLRLQFVEQGGDWVVDRALVERFTGLGFGK
jgi:hypothetical protein